MPKIRIGDTVINCKSEANLRKALLAEGLPLYNGIGKLIHCRGLGTCGTCAVQIEGDVSPPTKVEKWRLNFPPHRADQGLRLACQCKVLGDLEIKKLGGLWGNLETDSP